jgi:hypothetical protein
MGLVLLVISLLACSTRVVQVVTRYRLDLDSPKAAEGAACWDQCKGESNPTYRAWCIGRCPGVERVQGAGCQIDGRNGEQEICMTHVSEVQSVDESTRRAFGEAVAGAFVETAKIGAAAAVNSHSQETVSSPAGPAPASAAPKAARKPASPSIARPRPSHRPAEVKKRAPR